MTYAKRFIWLAVVVWAFAALDAVVGAQQQAPRFETEVTVSVSVPRSKAPGDYLLSFNTPIGLPGVSLPMGTYMFRYVGDNKSAIQVLSADGQKSYGLFAPSQIVRTRNIDKQSVWLIDPAIEGAPRRIQAWFEPGKSIGAEFLYIRGLLGATQ